MRSIAGRCEGGRGPRWRHRDSALEVHPARWIEQRLELQQLPYVAIDP